MKRYNYLIIIIIFGEIVITACNAGKEIGDAGKGTSDAGKETSDAGKETGDAGKATTDAGRETDGGCDDDCVFNGDAYGPYMIKDNEDLEPLAGCGKMQGDLFITGTDIQKLDKLHCLISVAGYTDIIGNSKLTDLDGLGRLRQIGWTLRISYNDNLINMDGLESLVTVGRAADVAGGQPGTGHLMITGNHSLVSLDGLRNLSYLDGDLWIKNNSNLPTCEAIGLKAQLEELGWKRNAIICGNLPDECGSEACPE